MLTQDDLERERYEARLKDQRDRAYFANYATYAAASAREEGIEQGRQEGLQQGRCGVGFRRDFRTASIFAKRLMGTALTAGGTTVCTAGRRVGGDRGRSGKTGHVTVVMQG